jgi:hypothetical protein
MASSALKAIRDEAFDASLFTGAYTGSAVAASASGSPAFTRQGQRVYISTAEGLGCAKGAMMAIGLEAGVVLFSYAVWHAWHLLK